MLARSPGEAIQRLKRLMADPSATVEGVTKPFEPPATWKGTSPPRETFPDSPGLSPVPRARESRVAWQDLQDVQDERQDISKLSSGSFSFDSEPKVNLRAPLAPQPPGVTIASASGRDAKSVDAEVVDALLKSLEKKQRECDKAYNVMKGTNVAKSLLSEMKAGADDGGAAAEGRQGAQGRQDRAPAAGKRRKKAKPISAAAGGGVGVAAADAEESIGGRVIHQLLKQAKDSELSNQELYQKYRKSSDDIAAARKKLKAAEAKCELLEQQVKEHREGETRMRQRLTELRIKSTKQSGKENRVQDSLQEVKQQLAVERSEHEQTKQRLMGLLRNQKVGKDAALASCKSDLQQERSRSDSFQQQLAETQQRLNAANGETEKLTQLVEHKAAQLEAVVRQLQEERRLADVDRANVSKKERHAQDLETAARDAVLAADSLSAKLKDQNATILAIKAERDHAKASLERATSELTAVRSGLSGTKEQVELGVAKMQKRLEMQKEDMDGVSEVLETAVGREPASISDTDSVHRLRCAADAIVRHMNNERSRIASEATAKVQELASRQQQCELLEKEVHFLKGQMSTSQAQANERESALRQRVRRAEQDRDECLQAAARADLLLSKLPGHK